MYLPILTLRTSGIPRCRIASRTALPCGSSTAAFGITITFAFIISRYLSATTRTSAIVEAPFICKDSLQDQNLERAIPSEHVNAYIAFIVSGEQKINARISYSQIANAYLGKEGRQNRLRKNQRLFGSRYAQAETSFEQKKDRCRGPRLGSAGYRIKCRRFTGAPGKTAK